LKLGCPGIYVGWVLEYLFLRNPHLVFDVGKYRVSPAAQV
jgi:hypothetical protein